MSQNTVPTIMKVGSSRFRASGSQSPPRGLMEDQLVTVETYQFLPEAQAAKLRLEGNDIQVFLADAETVNMDWLLGNAIGNIKLQVPAEQADHALTLLDEMREKARERREAEEEED